MVKKTCRNRLTALINTANRKSHASPDIMTGTRKNISLNLARETYVWPPSSQLFNFCRVRFADVRSEVCEDRAWDSTRRDLGLGWG